MPTDPLAQFRERCLQETRSLDEADLRFEDVVRLDDGERTQFEVSLQQPGAMPNGQSEAAGPVQGKVQLACAVEARLTSSGGGVEIAPDDWVGDQYLPPQPTSWTWLVTATDPGRADVLLQLRPAILVGGDSQPSTASLGTVEFTIRFEVRRTLADAAGEVWAWAVALVGFVAVVLGIPIAYRTLRERPRGSARPSRESPRRRWRSSGAG